MIIQCEQCRTKFKLDDSKVTERGVKVRCAKCRHVFTVRKPQDETAADATLQPSVAALAAGSDETVVMSAATAPSFAPTPSPSPEPEVAFEFGASAASDSSFDLGQTDAGAAPAAGFDLGEVSFADVDTTPPATATPAWSDETVVMAPAKPAEPATGAGIDFGTVVPQSAEAAPAADIAFDFGEARVGDQQTPAISFDFTTKPQVIAAAPAGDVDFGGFDFGDVAVAQPGPTAAAPDLGFSFDAAGTAPATAATSGDFDLSGVDFGTAASLTAAPQPSAAEAGGFDFSGMDFSAEAPAATAAPPAAAPAGDFDFSGMDFGAAAAGQAAPTPETASTPAGDSFGLGELDFGAAEAAPVAVAAAPAKASEALFSFSEVPAAAETAAPSAESAFESTPQPEEAPPLSISSRRRQSPLLSALIGLVAVLVIGALGFMGYLFIGDSGKATKFFGKQAPAEEGKITVQNVNAYFLSKTTAGELLVITGEAVNNYKKPRAALQVKGVVFGPNNQPLATKNVYAGNLLSREQLTTLPQEKIEAAMANQFGDSLSNMEVQPGKAISFTIVIVGPPANAKDYGVEPLGSTVAAAGK